MKRKIYNDLLKWKQTWNGRTAIMIDGARRVGKSYIAEMFSRNEYKSRIIIDFNNVSGDVVDLFENNLANLDEFFRKLSIIFGVKLYERQSVIIFDEVQQFPRARAAIKYLVADGRYDYIETGSLVSIKQNVRGIVIPSEEEHLNMNPMDFEEFLMATDNEMLLEYIKECSEQRKPLRNALHRKAMEALRLYMVVGGMPQAVAAYVDTQDLEYVDKVKRSILSLYRNDISKYAGRDREKATKIFDSIPSQLQRHEKKFILARVKQGARSRDYVNAFYWLEESRTINVCRATTAPNIGLGLNTDDAKFKLYLADTGLLVSMAFDERALAEEQIYRKLLLNKLEINKGMLIENLVAQMLRAAGNKLYFYSSNSADTDERMEIDFLLRVGNVTSRHNIIPVEVKSTARYKFKSLEKFIAKYKTLVSTPFVFHSADFKSDNGIDFFPLYMVPFLHRP